MAVLSVSYDLHRESRRDYQRLFEALKSFDGWYHELESTWFIWSEWTPYQVYEYLKPHLHQRDTVCITPIADDQGWWTQGFSERAVEWLRYHLALQAEERIA